MTDTSVYHYASGNLLEERNTYFYSAYHGEKLLYDWQARRLGGCDSSIQTSASVLDAKTQTDHLINGLILALDKSPEEAATALSRVDRLVQRFEVTKRIFDGYDDSWRALDRKRYHNSVSYALFAVLLSKAYEKTASLTYINALLKCGDILNAIDLPPDVRAHLPDLFIKERRYVEELRSNLLPRLVLEAETEPPTTSELPKCTQCQVLAGVIMIACASARSQAYIQALLANGMAPEEVIFLGPDREHAQNTRPPVRQWAGLALPDLAINFSTSCAQSGIRIRRIGSPDVNSDDVLQVLEQTDARLVIYSGISGQIVHKRILEAGPRFLHIHAGWLPEYRGSTTVYYSILNMERPSVSAIYLDDKIDTGPILKRQSYQAPPSWMDVDLVYDGSIRADLLCQIIRDYQKHGELISTATQLPEVGRTYYVIHPVLKHLALLSIGAKPNDV